MDLNVDNIVISKLVKTKTNSKYLVVYSEKTVRPLVLVMNKISRYIKTFKVEDKKRKLIFLRIDDKKLSQKYKAIWTKLKT